MPAVVPNTPKQPEGLKQAFRGHYTTVRGWWSMDTLMLLTRSACLVAALVLAARLFWRSVRGEAKTGEELKELLWITLFAVLGAL